MPTSLVTLLQTPTSYTNAVPKWNGGAVPPTFQPNVNPNPPGSRHDQYSINGNPLIQAIANENRSIDGEFHIPLCNLRSRH